MESSRCGRPRADDGRPKKNKFIGELEMEEKIAELVAAFTASVIFVNIFGLIGMFVVSIFKK